MKEIEFKPIAAFRLDGNTPFQDYSGYNLTFTRTGTEYKGVPLSSTASYGQFFDSTHVGSLTLPGFRVAGTETQSSSVSMVITPSSLVGSSTFTIKKSDGTETITFTRTTIQYNINYTGGAFNETFEFDYEVSKKLNLVITWTPTSIDFFINGEHVYTHEIPQANRPNIIFSGGTAWTLGTSSTRSAFINNLCFYRKALNKEQIRAIYEVNNLISTDSPSRTFGGIEIPVSTATLKPFFSKTWNSDADWNGGGHDSTETDSNQLHPRMVSGLTIASEWKTAVSFANPIVFPTFQWADVWWEGVNITSIEASLDGLTWSAVSKLSPLSIFSAGYNPTNTAIHFRVKFAAGLTEAHLDLLRINIYSTNAAQINEGRTITYTSPVVLHEERNVEDLRDDWGLRLDGGTLTISTDPSAAPINPQTVEIWLKQDPSAGFTPGSALTTNLSATYYNGFSASAIADQWEIVHFTYSAAITAAITMSGHFSVGKIVFYPTILTQAQCAQIVKSYMGTVTATIPSGASIAMSQPATNPKSYAYDWRISGASGTS